MLDSIPAKNLYKNIQKQLFYMIPEKWSKVYLYSSIIESENDTQTGEMFFYYYPKSMFKKNPINVYEVPKKFNIDEGEYLKLSDNLYNKIKELRKLFINQQEEVWTNITILIENYKFKVIYGYDNLQNMEYNNYERHIIWRYEYLNIPIETCSKPEKEIIKRYLEKSKKINNKVKIYEESIYQINYQNIIEYDTQQYEDKIGYQEEEILEIKNQILLDE